MRTNLCPNPSFESSVLGCSVTAGTGGVATVSRQTLGGYSGSGFLRAAWTAASTAAGTVVACGAGYRAVVTPLGLLSVSLYVRPSVALSLRAVATTSTAITAGTTTAVPGPYVSCLAAVWTRLTVTLTPASGRGFLEVSVQSQVGVPVSTLDVDAVLIEASTALGDYFDGSTARRIAGNTALRYAWVGTPHASRSTEAAAATITAAPLADPGAPQAGVTVTDLVGTALVTVQRSWDDGASWWPVRGAAEVEMAGGGFVRDYTPALNVPTRYRATVAGVGRVETSVTITSEVAWLQDPLDPRTAVPVTGYRGQDGGLALLSPSAGSYARSQGVDVAYVSGSAYPVAAVGQRRAPRDIGLHLRAAAQAQGALVRSISGLLESAGVVTIRGLPGELGLDPVAHVVAPDVTDSPVVGGLLGPRRDWQMSVQQVREPSILLAIPWWTYDQIRAAWLAAIAGVTYDQVESARPGDTYITFQADPEP